MVLVIIGIIVYTFRDSAGPILEQLEKTTPAVIAGICAMTVVYHCVEGVITTLLAKQYNREFTLGMGITNAFLCSFYRVATLGSGAGVAAIVYLGEHGIEYSRSFGMYMLQYAFHKISIAFFSMILFALNWNYMRVHFGEYMWLLLAGYLVTLIITVVLILFSCSRQFMGEKRLVAGTVGLNLIKFTFWYSIPYLIFLGQGEITLPQTMAVTSLSVMLAAVIPSPAGIGSTEFVFTALFSGIVGTGLAGSASLLYRFGTFVFPFLVGAVVVIIRRIYLKKTGQARL